MVEAAVERVTARGLEGEFGVLALHEPLLAALGPGVVEYVEAGRTRRVAISGGFAEVTAERVTLLARTAEPAEEIDAARAREARERAAREVEALGVLAPVAELEACRDELARAQARLAVLEG